MNRLEDLAKLFGEVATALEYLDTHPHGQAADGETKMVAQQACTQLAGGNPDVGRSLWGVIENHLGYMPYGAAYALIRATNAEHLVPDPAAPEVT